jgi:hypothetical protein
LCYLFDPATWPTSRVVGPTMIGVFAGESDFAILSGSYLAASSPDQAKVKERLLAPPRQMTFQEAKVRADDTCMVRSMVVT